METESTPIKRVRRSRAQINELLEAFRRSGSTQQAFCREHGLSVATFSNWRRKTEAPATGEGAMFRPVRLAPSAANCGPAVRLPDGVELFFPEGSSAQDIAALIMALSRSLSC